MTDTTESLRAVLETVLYEVGAEHLMWCDNCRRWQADGHEPMCLAGALATALARLEAAEPYKHTDACLEYVAKTGRAFYSKGRRDDAHRRALNMLDDWVDVTGFVQRETGYYYELQAVVEDAVECGAQAALGIRERLEGESGYAEAVGPRPQGDTPSYSTRT